MRITLKMFLVLIILSGTGCREKGSHNEQSGSLSKEQLADINRQLLIKDRERIISYIKRKGLKMEETETGLWYSENVKGNGIVQNGDNVTLEYVCSLLDGTILYDSQRDGLMNFRVGKSDIPSGLNEGIKLLGEGSEAILILPGYLGYGLLGDEKRIPARSILVYSIKILEVN